MSRILVVPVVPVVLFRKSTTERKGPQAMATRFPAARARAQLMGLDGPRRAAPGDGTRLAGRSRLELMGHSLSGPRTAGGAFKASAPSSSSAPDPALPSIRFVRIAPPTSAMAANTLVLLPKSTTGTTGTTRFPQTTCVDQGHRQGGASRFPPQGRGREPPEARAGSLRGIARRRNPPRTPP
jgi:hypothetical protein